MTVLFAEQSRRRPEPAATVIKDGLAATVEWYRSNQDWLAHLQSGAYREYYETLYRDRLDDSRAVTGRPGETA